MSLSVEKSPDAPSYVADLAEQLRQLVPGERYQHLRYLLDMVRAEAEEVADSIARETRGERKVEVAKGM